MLEFLQHYIIISKIYFYQTDMKFDGCHGNVKIDLTKRPQITEEQLLKVGAPWSKLSFQTFKNPYGRGAPLYLPGM